MTEDLVFRRAILSDAGNMVALIESAYRGEVSKQGWTTEAEILDGQRTDLAAVEELIENQSEVLLLAFQNQKLVGSVRLSPSDGECYLGMFAIAPNLQGHGLGRQFLAEAERVAKNELFCHEMRMHVISLRSELIAWYERRGYRGTGETAPFPYGDLRFGIPKRDDLVFHVFKKAL